LKPDGKSGPGHRLRKGQEKLRKATKEINLTHLPVPQVIRTISLSISISGFIYMTKKFKK